MRPLDPAPFVLDVATELDLVGLVLLAPPPFGFRVNELTSSIDRSPDTEPECARLLDGGGGGRGAFERGEVAPGGGGGGAELGEVVPPAAAAAAAPMTACTANDGFEGACDGGGGGGTGDRAGAGGGRGAELGGGGGGAGGSDGAAEDGGGGAGAPGNGGAPEGFRLTGGGGGFLPIGGGAGFIEADEPGRGAVVLLRFAIEGWTGKDGTARPGIAGAAPGGGLGAEKVGGFGAEDRVDSGSDRYEESRFAVATQSIVRLLRIITMIVKFGTYLLYRYPLRQSSSVLACLQQTSHPTEERRSSPGPRGYSDCLGHYCS